MAHEQEALPFRARWLHRLLLSPASCRAIIALQGRQLGLLSLSNHFSDQNWLLPMGMSECVGFGLIGNRTVGIVGALIGDWLLPRLGIHLGAGIVAAIVNATIRRRDPALPRSASRRAGLG